MKSISYQRKVPAVIKKDLDGNDIIVKEAYLQNESLVFTDNNKDIQIAEALKYSYNGEYTIESNTRPFETIQQEKITDLSNACNQVIIAGMDVETTEGTEHFSLEETDQINLSTALSAIEQGAKGYPYHADKKLCRMFTAVEIQAIAQAATAHKLYHTTLCNHLLTLVRQATTAEELDAITYSIDSLPINLQENMNKIIAAASSL